MPLDNKDKAILDVLKENSRLPIRSIAKVTGIRPSTVHERIKRLVKEKVIEHFTVKLSNKAIDENFIVFMLVKGTTDAYLSRSIIVNRNVKEVFGVTGEYDLMLKLKFSDVEEFNDFLLKFRRLQPGLRQTFTMVATANLKEGI